MSDVSCEGKDDREGMQFKKNVGSIDFFLRERPVARGISQKNIMSFEDYYRIRDTKK
jgi:hypothetical protein